MDVRLTASVTATGPSAPATDVIVTIIAPDGTVTNGDGGFVGTPETVALTNPAGGTYEVRACAFAGVAPQSYDGAVTLTASGHSPRVASGTPCPAPADTPKFTEEYIDTARAGGEPLIAVHPDGQLLWGSHAGTTHFYAPAAPSPTTGAFVENYQGQTYTYVSEDGETFDFVPRVGPADGGLLAPVGGIPATGFSDPEFAIDAAGNVYTSEINLANVAVYRSTDGGRSYGLQNVFAFTSSDRQWMEADREDELYMTANGFGGGSFPGGPVGQLAHFMAKSTDGGVTWGAPSTTNPDGVADLRIHDGVLYELSVTTAGDISIARFPNIRDEDTDFTVELLPVVSGVGLTGVQRLIDPTFDIDDAGNLYVVWSDNGSGLRDAGIYYASSSDGGQSFGLPVRVDPDDNADVWPWLAVGAQGQVVITWLQGDQVVEGTLPGEEGGDDVQWSVATATTGTGLGCAGGGPAGFRVTTASAEPDPHRHHLPARHHLPDRRDRPPAR